MASGSPVQYINRQTILPALERYYEGQGIINLDGDMTHINDFLVRMWRKGLYWLDYRERYDNPTKDMDLDLDEYLKKIFFATYKQLASVDETRADHVKVGIGFLIKDLENAENYFPSHVNVSRAVQELRYIRDHITDK